MRSCGALPDRRMCTMSQLRKEMRTHRAHSAARSRRNPMRRQRNCSEWPCFLATFCSPNLLAERPYLPSHYQSRTRLGPSNSTSMTLPDGIRRARIVWLPQRRRYRAIRRARSAPVADPTKWTSQCPVRLGKQSCQDRQSRIACRQCRQHART